MAERLKDMSFYTQLSVKEKRKFREILGKIEKDTRAQKERLIELYIKPIDERIALIQRVKKSEISIEYFQRRTEKLCRYLKKAIKEE